MLDKFVVTMYDRSSSTVAVDDAQLELFARKQRSYDAIPLQLEQLLFSTSDALYTRQHVYGVGLWCASLKRRVLLNGDGNKETAGAHYGLHSHQLLRVASNLRKASARRSVADGASVTSSV